MYDTEDIIDDIINLFKSDLNTEIGLVNTDKGTVPGDDLHLADIPTDTYIEHAISPVVFNYDVFLTYGIVDEDNVIDAQEDNFIEPITLMIEIWLPDLGDEQRDSQIRKLLRYYRALKSVVNKNSDIIRGYGKVKISGLTPRGATFGSNVYLRSGILVQTAITAR